MPRVTLQSELDTLAGMICSEATGISIEAISRKLGGSLSRRTLQRRLALLMTQGRIYMTGARRGARYGAASTAMRRTDADAKSLLHFAGESVPDAYKVYIPASVAGAGIKAYVSQPRHRRTPVGYRLAFLEQYLPNHTSYLPKDLLDQLHGMGRSPAGQAAAGTFARDILNRLLIDLSWASSNLEGNTYSHLDTERLIEFGEAAEGKNSLETQMILNHKQAIEYLVLRNEPASVDTATIITLHAFLADNLMVDRSAVGRIRRRVVEIGGSVYRPLAQPQRLEELFGIVVRMAAEIADPFEQAFFLMVHLPYLQPFEDVNKRVSRLAANIPFIRHNLCPLSFIDVPQQAYVDAMLGVYELNRVDLLCDLFVWAYERSCHQYVAVKQTVVMPDIFRLRHRNALATVIAVIVKQDRWATPRTIRSKIPASVPNVDHERFVQLVLTEFEALHVGNSVRFGIGPLEFTAWQGAHVRGS